MLCASGSYIKYQIPVDVRIVTEVSSRHKTDLPPKKGSIRTQSLEMAPEI